MVLIRLLKYSEKTILILLQIFFLIAIVRFFIVEPGRVNGPSMEHTFKDEQLFFVNKIIYLSREPRRFDVIQFLSPSDRETLIIKRVVGLPGETVFIKNARVWIRTKENQEFVLEEPYLADKDLTLLSFGAPYEFPVPEHSYFVMGDNRQQSNDSRNFGSLHRRLINGKVMGDY